MKARKILAMVAALALTAALAVGGTLAYLTSTKTVTNTFTVGNVQIKLDEAQVNQDGTVKTDADGEELRTEIGNIFNSESGEGGYKLMPGHTYTKDPTVTVVKGSEESYVRMLVTINKQSELDAIFDKLNEGKADDAKLTILDVFGGVSNDWTLAKETENSDNTRTYEFRYNTTVKPAADQDEVLDDLFETITVPGGIDNDDLEQLQGLEITVVAQAIQADGFVANGAKTAADVAWEAFGA